MSLRESLEVLKRDVGKGSNELLTKAQLEEKGGLSAKKGAAVVSYIENENLRSKGETHYIWRLYAPVGDVDGVGWILDQDVSECMICTESFSSTSRRHHCRSCGSIVCANCSPEEAEIEEFVEWGPQRVCHFCFWGQYPVFAARFRKANVDQSGYLRESSVIRESMGITDFVRPSLMASPAASSSSATSPGTSKPKAVKTLSMKGGAASSSPVTKHSPVVPTSTSPAPAPAPAAETAKKLEEKWTREREEALAASKAKKERERKMKEAEKAKQLMEDEERKKKLLEEGAAAEQAEAMKRKQQAEQERQTAALLQKQLDDRAAAEAAMAAAAQAQKVKAEKDLEATRLSAKQRSEALAAQKREEEKLRLEQERERTRLAAEEEAERKQQQEAFAKQHQELLATQKAAEASAALEKSKVTTTASTTSSSSEKVTLALIPGFVIKSSSTKSGKVFINIVGAPQIQSTTAAAIQKFIDMPVGDSVDATFKLRGFVTTPPYRIDGGETTVYDVVINEKILQGCLITEGDDRLNPDTPKPYICEGALRLVRMIYKDPLDPAFKLPKIRSGYKGVTSLPEQLTVTADKLVATPMPASTPGSSTDRSSATAAAPRASSMVATQDAPRPSTVEEKKFAPFLEQDEHIVACALVNKPNPLGMALYRQLILTNSCKLVYVDVKSMSKKGEIAWTPSTVPAVYATNQSTFEVSEHGNTKKVYKFIDDKNGADFWVTHINRTQKSNSAN